MVKKKVRPQNLSLLQLADTFIADFTRKVEKGLRSSQTLRQWKATRNKIAEFVRCQYGTTDISVCQIDYSFATKFYVYLTVERNELLKEAAAKKQLKNTKQLLSLAESNNYIHKNPIQNFRCGGDKTDVAPLEFHEVFITNNVKNPAFTKLSDFVVNTNDNKGVIRDWFIRRFGDRTPMKNIKKDENN